MDKSPRELPASAAAKPGKSRWIPWIVVVVVALLVGGIQAVETSEAVPRAEALLTKVAMTALGATLIFLWFVFFGAASRAVRACIAVTVALAVLVFAATIKVESVSGDVFPPRLSFRWSPHPDELLPKAVRGLPTQSGPNLSETTPHDYPAFLGADRNATIDNVALARDWQARPPRLLWRQPIGAAWSAFAVVGRFAVTQEQRGEEELVTCYDLETGKLEWAQSSPVRFSETLAGIGPRATPTIHDGKVYALGAMGHLHCLDGASGKVIWQHDILTENGGRNPQWGKSCSPLVHENLVIVSAGGGDGKSLVAYDKETGDKIWSGGDASSSYASPTVSTLAGQRQIVIVNAAQVTAHDPADGHVLWSHAWPERGVGSPNVSQPLVVGDDRLLLSKGYGIGSSLWQVRHSADAWQVDVLWTSRNLKTKFTNVLQRDGFAYALDEGVLECVQIDSGQKKWKNGKFGHGQALLVDDLLLVQSEGGELALVEAVPDGYHELARIAAIDGVCWNPPALAGNKLLVRSNEEAACYELFLTSD